MSTPATRTTRDGSAYVLRVGDAPRPEQAIADAPRVTAAGALVVGDLEFKLNLIDKGEASVSWYSESRDLEGHFFLALPHGFDLKTAAAVADASEDPWLVAIVLALRAGEAETAEDLRAEFRSQDLNRAEDRARELHEHELARRAQRSRGRRAP